MDSCRKCGGCMQVEYTSFIRIDAHFASITLTCCECGQEQVYSLRAELVECIPAPINKQ